MDKVCTFCQKIVIFRGMKLFLLVITLSILSTACLAADDSPLSSDMFFNTMNDGEPERYICIQIHRGDRIELVGWLNTRDGSGTDLLLRTVGGRTFILVGELLSGLNERYLSGHPEKMTIEGTVIFEGREDRLPELDVTDFHPLTNPQ